MIRKLCTFFFFVVCFFNIFATEPQTTEEYFIHIKDKTLYLEMDTSEVEAILGARAVSTYSITAINIENLYMEIYEMWSVNKEKTVNPQPLVNTGGYIYPSGGIITSPYGYRPDMPPAQTNHEGMDFSIRTRRE